MSSVQPARSSWLQRNLHWTRTPSAWRRRIAELILFAAALGAVFLTRDSSALVRLGSYALAVLAGAVAAEGWFGVFGPVLFYDMLRSARRGRFVWLRAIYAALLLFLLLAAYMGNRSYGGATATQMESALASSFFQTFSVVQFLVLSVLTPAYVAGAISEEKDRRTLEFLLATDLRNREIVLSKFGARLANLVLMVLVGLPLVSMLQFLGGVEPVLVQGSFAATALTVFGLAGVSILISTYFKKPRDAVAVAYLFIVTYIVLSSLSFMAVQSRALWVSTPLWFVDAFTLGDLFRAFNSGNLALYFEDIVNAGAAGTLDTVVPEMLGRYALFHVPLGVLCVVWSIWRLRSVALAQMHGKSRKGSLSARILGRPPVGNYPILWKEVFAEGGVRINWMTWIVIFVLLGATFVPFALIVIHHLEQPYASWNRWNSLPYHVNMWVRFATAGIGCLTLLAVAVRAATSYSSERDRQTLDSLLTTPLDSTPILLGKWFGSLLTVRLAWIWLALVWGLALAVGGLHPVAVPLIALAWIVYAAFLATLGLWFSVLSRTSLRATVWTLMIGGAVALGHWLPWMCCAFLPGGGRDFEYLLKMQAGLTPPFVLGLLPFFGEEFTSPGDSREMIELIGFSLFGLFAYGVATVLLWSGLTLRFRAITGREGFGRPERGWLPRRSRPARLDYENEEEPAVVVIDPLPAREPLPPIKPQGARLIEETWDEPPRRPPEEDNPSRR